MALSSQFNIGSYVVGNDNSKVEPSECFDVLSYQVVTRCNDDGFHPTSVPKVNYVEIVLGCDTTPMPLYKWYRNNDCVNGCIIVEIPDKNKITNRMIVFEEGQCFFFNEKYCFDSPKHQVTLRITVGKLSVDTNIFTR